MVTIEDIRAAAERIRPYVHRTPVITSRAIDQMFGAQIFFKCENLQKVGAFKARGACNAVFQLDHATAARGVVTHSSGNHAQALAYAAGLRGIPCTIVMPTTAPAVKRRAVEEYGASIVSCEPTVEARLSTMNALIEQTGAHAIPPYDDERVIAGQGTAALEFLEDYPTLEVMMAPVGGGGLMSGTAVATRALAPYATLYGAEPSIDADAQRSLQTGIIQPPPQRVSMADGLRTSLGELTFAELRHHHVQIITASEESILESMIIIMERLKVVVEPSAAVTLGCLREHPELVAGRRVGIILCGGNLDLRSWLKPS
jgi:threonine dehydratase